MDVVELGAFRLEGVPAPRVTAGRFVEHLRPICRPPSHTPPPTGTSPAATIALLVLALLVDAGVHSGPKRAVEWLQTALGVTADGILGPRTRAALGQADPMVLYRRVLAARLRFLGRLITQDQRQAAFAAGWMNRMAEWVEAQP